MVDRADLRWEASLASIAAAGVRPLVQDSVSALAGVDTTYTIVGGNTKRAVIFAESSADTDIRVNVEAVATVTGFPLIAGAYFVVEADKDDVLHFFNTTASTITVHIMEIK